MHNSRKRPALQQLFFICILLLIAFLPRLISYTSGMGRADDGSLRLINMDGYYYLRMTRYLLGEDVGVRAVDDKVCDFLRYAPEGSGVGTSTLLLPELTAGLYRIFHPMSGCTIYEIAYAMNLLLPPLCIIPTFIFLRKILADLKMEKGFPIAATASGIMIGLNEIYLQRTLSGYYDTDLLILFFSTFQMFFLYCLLLSDKHAISSTVGLVLVSGLFARWWSGNVFFLITTFGISGCVLLWGVIQFLRKKRLFPKRSIAALVSPSAGIIVINGWNKYRSTVINAADMFRYKDNTSYAKGEGWFPNARNSIAEMQSPSFYAGNLTDLFQTRVSSGGGQGIINYLGGIGAIAAAVLGLLVLFVLLVRKKDALSVSRFVFFFLWTVATIAGGRLAIHYLMLLSAPVALAAGLFIAYVLYRIQDSTPKTRALVSALLLFAIALPSVTGAFESATVSPGTVISDDIADAANDLAKEKNDNTILASWWDLGYYYEDASNIATLFDGGTQSGIRIFWMSKAFSTSNPILCDRILQMLFGSGDEATKWLLEKTEDGQSATALLTQLLCLEKEDAEQLLRKEQSFTDQERRELLDLSHPKKKNELILAIHSDMAHQYRWYMTFGDWEAYRDEYAEAPFYFSRDHEKTSLVEGDNYFFVDAEDGTFYSLLITFDATKKEHCLDVSLLPENADEQSEYPYRIRNIYFASDKRGIAETYASDTALFGMSEDDTATNVDLTVIETEEGLTVSLTDPAISDSLVGELLFREGRWQDRYVRIDAKEPLDREDVTVSLWRVD